MSLHPFMVFGALALFLFLRHTPTGPLASPLDVFHAYHSHFLFAGSRYAVDPELLAAIAWVESRGDAHAVNTSDPSYGLMQVFCFTDPHSQTGRCQNKLHGIDGWPATPNSLLDPSRSIHIAAQILADDQARNQTLPGAIAAYNGGAHKGSSYSDQAYIDDVMRAYYQIQGAE